MLYIADHWLYSEPHQCYWLCHLLFSSDWMSQLFFLWLLIVNTSELRVRWKSLTSVSEWTVTPSSCRGWCTSQRCRLLSRLLNRTLWWLQKPSLTYLFSKYSLLSVSCSCLSCLQIVNSADCFVSCQFSIELHHLFFYVVLLHHYEDDVCMMTFQMRCSRI